jgi:protein SCO1/2
MSVAAGANGTPPLQIAEHVLSIRRSPARREELVALLAEQSPIYRGLGTGDAERIRGFVLASFETLGLPESALPFVLEELETGINPYTVAAAAKALRGSRQVSDRTLALLVAAARRIESNDDNVQYDTMDPGDRVPPRTSALAEIVRTIAALGAKARPLWDAIDAMVARDTVSADAMTASEQVRRNVSGQADEPCCCAAPPALVLPGKAAVHDIDAVALEDQSGATFAYGGFFLWASFRGDVLLRALHESPKMFADG